MAEQVLHTPLLPTENFENTLPDGIMTVNAFEMKEQGYDHFLSQLKSRLVDICAANPWLLGRLEQTRAISLTSPLNGDFEVVWPAPGSLSKDAIQAKLDQDIFAESPTDLPLNTVEGSPLADLVRFVASCSDNGTASSSRLGLPHNLSAQTYQELSKLLKATASTAIPTGPEVAKAKSSLFRVVVLPTPSHSHALVIVSLCHAVADGNTYHRILHMLFHSTDRKTKEPVPVTTLINDVRVAPALTKLDAETIVQNYKRERDIVVPEAHILDQIKLGLDIGKSAFKQQFQEGSALQSFVALINLDQVNRIKQEYANQQEAVFGKDAKPITKPLSTNDVLVCELSKLLNVDRMDTNMDVRVKVLSERMGIEKELAANAAGNFVAMLPFFRPHFTNPWYVRKAMTRPDNVFQADAVPRPKDSYITGNLSNWSGFTVGTQLGGANNHDPTVDLGLGASLLLHLPINVTASGTTPFEQALVFCPFQDKPKQLAVVFTTHRYQKLVARIQQQPADKRLLIPFAPSL